MIGWLAFGIGAYFVAGAVLRRFEPFKEPERARMPQDAAEGQGSASASPKDRPRPPAAPPPPPGPSRDVYRSQPERVRVDDTGWIPLPSGGLVTAMPLVDVSQRLATGDYLYARLDQPTAEDLAASMGGRLLTREQVDEISRIGYHTKPCTLVHSKADFAGMRSLDFARRHDECMRAQLAGWQRDRPVQGGKDYVTRRPSERTDRQVEYGWDKAEGSAVDHIQSPGQSHELTYTDYSQLTRVWRAA